MASAAPPRRPPHWAWYTLPNSVTLLSIFCGFTSMILVGKATLPHHYWGAAYLIGCAGFLDGVDGRVARLTGTQSPFGVRMDSLADVITFGVAPAWLAYQWGLQHIFPWGVVAAFAYAAACSIRLARFNVMSASKTDPRFFQGLPAPMGAAMVAGFIVMWTDWAGGGVAPVSWEPWVALYVAAVGGLMVSNIPFAGNRGFGRGRVTRFIVPGSLICLVVLSIVTRFEATVYFMAAAYAAIQVIIAAVRALLKLTGTHT